jgi:hypothetical protein
MDFYSLFESNASPPDVGFCFSAGSCRFAGPNNFGPGNQDLNYASSTSGPQVTLDNNNLLVPAGYTSGTLLASSVAIWDNATLASLGVTPGQVFRWTWGPEPDQGFTIDTTPLPAALPLFATGIGGLGLLGWRRNRKLHRSPEQTNFA